MKRITKNNAPTMGTPVRTESGEVRKFIGFASNGDPILEDFYGRIERMHGMIYTIPNWTPKFMDKVTTPDGTIGVVTDITEAYHKTKRDDQCFVYYALRTGDWYYISQLTPIED